MSGVPASSHGTTFDGGTITTPLVISPTDPAATPLTITHPVGTLAIGPDSIIVQPVELTYPTFLADPNGSCLVQTDNTQAGALTFTNHQTGLSLASPRTCILQAQGIAASPITSGALPTAAFVSGTERQLSTTRDVCLVVPFTGDGTNNAATLKIELSPDDVTFSILDTLSIAAALNLSGALNVPVTLSVPASWYVKLTAVHGTIGTGTYY